jgi:catechol 2,3-dioxygenase-like lactoylglutathione lyase family enzyme
MQFELEHLGLPCREPLALKEWYTRVLGAEVAYHNDQKAPFLLRLAGGVMIELYEGDFSINETRDNKLNGWRHVAIGVSSIEAGKAELERRGVKFTESVRPAGGGGRVLFFSDPEGNLLHLVERPADSPLRKTT